MMSKIYTDNLASCSSDSSRGIVGRGVTMQATWRNLSNIDCHYCKTFGYSKNDCADVKVGRQRNQRRRQRQHKQQSGYQPHQSKPGGQQQQRGEEQIWCLYNKITTHSALNAAPGRKIGSTATPTSLKSVSRVFLEFAARGIFLCETTSTKSPVHSRRGRFRLQPSPP